jgi:TonB family protein
MRLILIESDRGFLQTAESAAISIIAHAGLAWLILASTTGGIQLPTTERDAMAFFLLPPDRVPSAGRDSDIPQVGPIGSGLDQAAPPLASDAGFQLQSSARKGRHRGPRGGAKGDQPLGTVAPFVAESVFSVLEVDQMVERFESSAAPVYPEELMRRGTEGQVEATYVVDTAGMVDTTTFQVLQSDDSQFTQSVRSALPGMRFRPAKRAGRAVRQLVGQRFRFKIAPPVLGAGTGN